MHFVSAQTEEEQISDIINFLKENMRSSIKDDKVASFINFEDKLTEY